MSVHTAAAPPPPWATPRPASVVLPGVLPAADRTRPAPQRLLRFARPAGRYLASTSRDVVAASTR
jgi:hypothetical protein